MIGSDRSSVLRDAVQAVFADGGRLAQTVADYEPREGQRLMAEAVAAVLESGGTLLAEAGTGTGKTLAYLIPALLSRQRVLVSTGTKNLQEQIFFKDLPALREALRIPFTATLMKGRSNYLCLHRWEIYRDGVEHGGGGRLFDMGDRVLLPMLEEWVGSTATGDRAELRELPEDLSLWKDISADAETCLGAECPHYGDCFVTLMRQRAAESDIVIVNHHLLCADAAVRHGTFGEVIPSSSTLVVDEAHQLEDVATQYFGLSFSNYRVDDFVRDAERSLLAAHKGAPYGQRRGRRASDDSDAGRDYDKSDVGRSFADSDVGRGFTPRQEEEISRALTRVSERSRIFFARLAPPIGYRSANMESRARYSSESMAEHVEDGMMLAGALEGVEASLALAQRPADSAAGRVESSGDTTEAIAALQRRAGELHHDLRILIRADDPDLVYYLESRARGIFLRAAPVDVSRIVREALFDRFHTAVLTSATLAVDDSFAYVKSRLGIRQADEIRVPSEFDYATQALLYLPRRMPPPRSSSRTAVVTGPSPFAHAVARETIEILKRSRGRAFVLFTSHVAMRAVHQLVEMQLPYPMMLQGQAPRSALLDRFRSTPNAVLFATSSFWQGVDVVGDALSCVIVDKLPFASPEDPVTAARIDAIRSRGGDAFAEYQVPLAILALRQGLGRLIRHRTDRGVLAVLDPRLKSMGYGRRFLTSLPPAPVTHELDAVTSFFK